MFYRLSKKISNHTISNAYNNERGTVLLSVIVIFMVLTVLAGGAIALMSSEYAQADSSHNQKQAYYIAKAGADICAAYMVENPDSLSNEQMEAFIDSVIASGESSDTKLESTSQDFFNITVTRSGEAINILSVGTVLPNSKSSVTLTLDKVSVGLGLDAAMYINSDSLATNSATVNGDVVFTSPNIELELRNSATVTGSYSYEEKNFIMPDFPSYPTGLTESIQEYPSTLTHNTYYTNGLTIQSKNITINVGNDDFIIRTKSLEITNTSHINISRTGTGRVILFIDSGEDVNISNSSTVNKNGSPDDFIIYCNNGENEFNLQNSSIVYADLYVIAGKLSIGNSSTYSGHLVFEGTIDGQGLEFRNSSSVGDSIIYAPTSQVYLENSFSMYGSIIADKLEMNNSSTVSYADIEDSYLLDSFLVNIAFVKKHYN